MPKPKDSPGGGGASDFRNQLTTFLQDRTYQSKQKLKFQRERLKLDQQKQRDEAKQQKVMMAAILKLAGGKKGKSLCDSDDDGGSSDEWYVPAHRPSNLRLSLPLSLRVPACASQPPTLQRLLTRPKRLGDLNCRARATG